MDLQQPSRLEDATSLGDMLQDRDDFALRQVGAIKRGALALGEAGATGAAIEQAILPLLAEPAGDGEVCGAAAAEVGAAGIQATESREVVHGSRCGLQGQEGVRLGRLLEFYALLDIFPL